MKTPVKVMIVAALAVAVGGTVALKRGSSGEEPQTSPTAQPEGESVGAAELRQESRSTSSVEPRNAAALPRLIDLGADKCIPCKMMAPILEELKDNYANRFTTEFIDVWKNPDEGKKHGVEMIPTQIFYDAQGTELFRHVGFFGKEDILAKWKELGVDTGTAKAAASIVREEPVAADTRPREAVCFLCDGDVNPRAKVVVQGNTDRHVLCGPHCYFIYFSSIVDADPAAEDAKVSITDFASGNLIPATTAQYLYGMDAKGRPTIKAFADKEAAAKEQQTTPGNLLQWDVLRSKELATRCAFCDRAVYPEDASKVTIAGATHAYGCCTHCAMGVAARTGTDIAVEAYDGLTGEPIRVKTLNGMIASLEPATAVAWFGQKRNAEGNWVSAGCFKQGFFLDQASLQKWLEARPSMTGRQITIDKALADKMKLSPEQIAKACKLGECQ